MIEGDVVLIRSEESVNMADRAWHTGWHRLISGTLTVETVEGTHAELAINANAPMLAEAVSEAIGAGGNSRSSS